LRVCVDTSILIDILKDEFRPFQEKLPSILTPIGKHTLLFSDGG